MSTDTTPTEEYRPTTDAEPTSEVMTEIRTDHADQQAVVLSDHLDVDVSLVGFVGQDVSAEAVADALADLGHAALQEAASNGGDA
jgi:hypothetical protein